jgi:hypothetical protein
VTLDGAGQAAAAYGPWVAVLGVVLAGLRAIVSGALVPRSTLDVLIGQWEARLARETQETADWREAHRLSEVAREKQAQSQLLQLEVARAAEDALKGFRSAAAQNIERGRPPGVVETQQD